MGFSSGSESRDIIRRTDLLRKRVPSRRGGACERHLTVANQGGGGTGAMPPPPLLVNVFFLQLIYVVTLC